MAAGRVTWVDNARGIGIILVVYGHVARGLQAAGILPDSALYRFVDATVYSFHMPLFFFLSGIFFLPGYRKYRAGLFLKKVEVIVYPYFVWSLIQLCIKIGLSTYTNTTADYRALFSIIWLPVEQFWFLYSLFLITTLHILIVRAVEKLSGNLKGIVLAVLVPALVLFFVRPFLPGMFQVQTVATYMVYFSLGIWFSERYRSGGENWHNRPFLALPVCFLLLCYAVLLKDFYDAGSPLLQISLALTGMGSVVVLSWSIGPVISSLCSFLGRYSLEIFCVHIIAASGMRIILQHVLHVSAPSIHLVVGVVAGLLLPVLFVKTLEKCSIGPVFFSAPFFLSFRTTPANRK